MSTPYPSGERPTSSRPFSWGAAAHAALALAAAPLFTAFAWQTTLASVGDDSVSYLAMARWFAGSAGPLLTPWLPWHSHFPPLFPMILAATGGAHDFLVAHLVVAAFAIACVPLIARYAALRLHSDWGGLCVAAAFLAMPTAWISAKGILSEPLYLALSVAALLAHEKWLARDGARARGYLIFGVLLALAYSARAVGLLLVAAYAIHEGVRAARTRDLRPAAWLALVPVALFAIAWPLARPGGHVYQSTLESVVRTWLDNPAGTLHITSKLFAGGWVASFVCEGADNAAMRGVFYAAGIVALAGSVRAALRNRIDGWYVILSVAVLFAWVFGVDNMRRLLYPVLPLALLHAGEAVLAAVRMARVPASRYVAGAFCALPFALCAPATALVAEKSRDATPLVAGSRYRASDISDYYRIANIAESRALAAKHAATLAGLEALQVATPPGSRVMWMRPEYVALLGGRAGVPLYYDWDARKLAASIREAHVDYLVVAGISKSDLAVRTGQTAPALRQAEPYARPALGLANPFTGQDEFILLRIDSAALDAYLAAPPAAR